MDLGDGRRGQRLRVETGEDRLQGPAEVLLHHPADGGPRLGGTWSRHFLNSATAARGTHPPRRR